MSENYIEAAKRIAELPEFNRKLEILRVYPEKDYVDWKSNDTGIGVSILEAGYEREGDEYILRNFRKLLRARLATSQDTST